MYTYKLAVWIFIIHSGQLGMLEAGGHEHFSEGDYRELLETTLEDPLECEEKSKDLVPRQSADFIGQSHLEIGKSRISELMDAWGSLMRQLGKKLDLIVEENIKKIDSHLEEQIDHNKVATPEIKHEIINPIKSDNRWTPNDIMKTTAVTKQEHEPVTKNLEPKLDKLPPASKGKQDHQVILKWPVGSKFKNEIDNRARYSIPKVVEQKVESTKEGNELSQQEQYYAPISIADESLTASFGQEKQSFEGVKLAESKLSRQTTGIPNQAERIRAALMNAADVARQLQQRNQNHDETRRSNESNFSSTSELDFVGQTIPKPTESVWLRPVGAANVNDHESPQDLSPKFLGFGQLQRIDPFNSNMRTQARLSCQFSDLEEDFRPAKNMTISDVEWARITGNYSISEHPFDCKQEFYCHSTQVNTDTLTTVHPRPAIQSYINVMAPSYSLTLHDIQEKHLGVYRCSAKRSSISDGRKKDELVYRIIPLEIM